MARIKYLQEHEKDPCAVTGSWPRARSRWPPTRPTFYKDVLPILQNNCQTCHRPGEVAPMSLHLYERGAALGASAIKKARGRQADAAVVRGSRLRALRERAQAERRARSTRSPRGRMPARRRATRRTRRRRSLRERLEHQARRRSSRCRRRSSCRPRGTINYKYILVKTNFPEDMWVVAAEMRPGNPKVLHHGKVWVRPPGSTWMENAVPGEAYENETQRDIIGRNSRRGRQRHPRQVQSRSRARSVSIMEGAAKFMPKGSDLVFEMHYTTIGQADDRTSRSSGSCWRKKPPQKRYYFHAGPTAQQSRDSARRRQRRSGQRNDARRGRASSSTRSRTCTFAARISSCA